MRQRFVVEEASAGERIDRFLAAHLSDCSRSYIQKLLRDGLVFAGEEAARQNLRLRAGDVLTVDLPEMEELSVRPEEIPLDILYEDRELLVVNKPKGMVVHPAAGHAEHTLVNAVLHHCGEQLSGINGVLRPGIVHRIDKDTTGALLVCKSDRAHRSLAAQLARHSIARQYRAICLGSIREERRIEGNIGRDPKNRKRMAVVPDGSGKPAVTFVRPLSMLAGHSYVACELLTGRTHQIRVHLSSIGHPVLGDPLYGPAKSKISGLAGQVLHAEMIGFSHPVSGEYMEFHAPLPEEFENLLTRLAK